MTPQAQGHSLGRSNSCNARRRLVTSMREVAACRRGPEGWPRDRLGAEAQSKSAPPAHWVGLANDGPWQAWSQGDWLLSPYADVR